MSSTNDSQQFANDMVKVEDEEMSCDEDSDNRHQNSGYMLREQDRFLPICNIIKIMKYPVPDNGKIAKDARECIQECVSEFISFVTSEAIDRSTAENRKTVNGDDLLYAFANLGFDNYVEPLSIHLQKFREATKCDRNISDSAVMLQDDSSSSDIRETSGTTTYYNNTTKNNNNKYKNLQENSKLKTQKVRCINNKKNNNFKSRQEKRKLQHDVIKQYREDPIEESSIASSQTSFDIKSEHEEDEPEEEQQLIVQKAKRNSSFAITATSQCSSAGAGVSGGGSSSNSHQQISFNTDTSTTMSTSNIPITNHTFTHTQNANIPTPTARTTAKQETTASKSTTSDLEALRNFRKQNHRQQAIQINVLSPSSLSSSSASPSSTSSSAFSPNSTPIYTTLQTSQHIDLEPHRVPENCASIITTQANDMMPMSFVNSDRLIVFNTDQLMRQVTQQQQQLQKQQQQESSSGEEDEEEEEEVEEEEQDQEELGEETDEEAVEEDVEEEGETDDDEAEEEDGIEEIDDSQNVEEIQLSQSQLQPQQLKTTQILSWPQSSASSKDNNFCKNIIILK